MANVLLPKLSSKVRLCCCSKTVIFWKNLSTSTKICQIKPQPDTKLNIFDREAKRLQKERAALLENVEVYDYLKDEIGDRLADRLFDIKRKFQRVLNLGCGRGYISKRVFSDNVTELIVADCSSVLTGLAACEDENVKVSQLVCDEEHILGCVEPGSVDVVISNLSLHWVNDLPGCFEQIMTVLKSDGVFLAAVFGGDTLYELRSSLQLAELERLGGVSPHISPFARVRDVGSLMTRAGFVMQTIDTDEIVVRYPSMLDVMLDVKGMGEGNAAWNRKLHLNRDVIAAASVIYQQLYGSLEDGSPSVPATYETINLIGWKPDPTQPKPLKRGTGEISLKDLHRLDEIMKTKPTKIKLDE